MADHNLKHLLDLGLCASIHSDDPAYFGGYLTENFLAVQQALALSLGDIVEIKKMIKVLSPAIVIRAKGHEDYFLTVGKTGLANRDKLIAQRDFDRFAPKNRQGSRFKEQSLIRDEQDFAMPFY